MYRRDLLVLLALVPSVLFSQPEENVRTRSAEDLLIDPLWGTVDDAPEHTV